MAVPYGSWFCIVIFDRSFCVLYLLMSFWILIHFTGITCTVILYTGLQSSVRSLCIEAKYFTACPSSCLVFSWFPLHWGLETNSHPLTSGQFISWADKHIFTAFTLLAGMHHISVALMHVSTKWAVSGNNNAHFFISSSSSSSLHGIGSCICSNFTFPFSFLFSGVFQSHGMPLSSTVDYVLAFAVLYCCVIQFNQTVKWTRNT